MVVVLVTPVILPDAGLVLLHTASGERLSLFALSRRRHLISSILVGKIELPPGEMDRVTRADASQTRRGTGLTLGARGVVQISISGELHRTEPRSSELLPVQSGPDRWPCPTQAPPPVKV